MALIKKINYLYFFVCVNCFAQTNSKIDFEHVFKKWIYIEKTSELINDKYDLNPITIKNDTVFNNFNSNLKLIVTSVKSNLPSGFFVKSVSLDSQNVINMNPNLNPYNIGIKSFSYTNQCSGKLVLIFNLKTGMSYRISGFNGNDYLDFLSDLKNILFEDIGKKFKRSQLMNKYFIEHVDLKCIYKGLMSEEQDNNKKFPCLKSCFDYTITQ